MKLVLAVIQNEDESALIQAMEAQGLGITQIGSSGGFVRANNVTLMTAVEDDQLERVLGLLNKHCKRRTKHLRPRVPSMQAHERFLGAAPIQIGGATVFIVNLERMEKIS